MRTPIKTIGRILCATALTAAVVGHVRLIYSGNGQQLSWQNVDNLSVVIQGMGSADVPGKSDEIALRNAIAAWNDVDGSLARLVEDSSPAAQARTDWSADDVHLLTFDESNTSGYFPSGSGIVAITPLEFLTTGRILDADVLFNGQSFLFGTDGTPGRFDIQDVATHELGHLLGLDHSGVAGASMYPYVDPSIVLHRSLSMDDIGGLRDMYPSQVFATITGVLKRSSDSSALPGGYVIAVDGFGRTIGSALADATGTFRIQGLPGGIYDVWADPLDSPVSASNLTPGHTIETDFESKLLGQVTLGNGATQSLGDQFLDADVSVSLGRVADDYPLRVIAGRTVACTVRGSGLAATSTLSCSDPTVTITPTFWNGTLVTFNVTVPANAPMGHIDLLVTTVTGDQDLLPGALEVTPSDPEVSAVTPSQGPGTGGYALQITGSNFRPGSRVVIGNHVYVDGEPGGCTVANSTTINLTLANTVAGPHDVVVIDSSGVEGRLDDGFECEANPVIDSVFPVIGAAAGGTQVTLRGSNFVPGATIEIDGASQINVAVLDSATLTFETLPGTAGGPYTLLLENPGGEQSSATFVYSNESDPMLTSVSPQSGPAGGGTEVTIQGSGFDADTQVVFGADPFTGQGGVPAASVTVVSPTMIEVVSPASGSVHSSVLVQDSATTQASVSASGFTYNNPANFSTDFSLGGCHAVAATGPTDWRHAAGGTWWMALAYLLLAVRLWRARG